MAEYDLHVAGTKFAAGAKERIAELSRDGRVEVILKPEPTNSHDPYAVMVLHENLKLGYVPSFKSFQVAQIIEEGRLDACWLVEGRLKIEYRRRKAGPGA